MENQETKDLVFKQLDMISGSVEDSCKQFEVELAPINLIEKTVNIGKIDVSKLEDDSEQVLTFFNEYNKMLDLLIDQCKDDAEDMGTTKIPLDLFKSHVELIKSAFIGAEA